MLARLHGGIHYLGKTLELGPADSGMAITAAAGEKAWLSGGVELDLAWTKVRGSRASNLFVADVSAAGVEEIPGLFSIGGDDADPSAPRRFTRARYGEFCKTFFFNFDPVSFRFPSPFLVYV